ncbi:spliceosome-associated protein CWC27 homolog isoform X2 [Aplysia californica]|nr:spliceosome-associated protein CWC27 homolog isoform X2 [Aplysia californica]
MEGYYDDTIFHRVVKDFIVQGGDPTGTGTGGESIYGGPFKDEFHSRLRFVRRGLVAMANAGPHDNGSQFFFTLGEALELQNKHTIFGKVTGPTLFNMLKLQEVETDGDERPLYPHNILKTEILSNPFEDIVPRVIKKPKKEKEEDKRVKSKSKATKNFSLLSFGEEAEEDEEQTFKASKKFSGKSKSSHDLIDDPNLSSVPVLDPAESDKGGTKRKMQGEEVSEISSEEIRKKLKKENVPEVPSTVIEEELTPEEIKKNRSDEIRREQKKLKKELKAAKKKAENEKNTSPPAQAEESDESPVKKEEKGKEGTSDFLESFKQERQKFMTLKKKQSKKGEGREEQTLALLAKFQSKLTSAKQLSTGYSDSEGEEEKKEDDNSTLDDSGDISWMKHKLQFDESGNKKVLDANVTDSDRYEIYDPRNPLTQRRRESSKKKSKQK